jgi:ferredoxin
MKTKLFMQFPTKLTDTPVTYELIKRFDLKVNILKANIDFNMVGTMLYDLEGSAKAIAESVSYLKNLGLDAKLVSTVITIDENRCTDCGLCTSVCGIKALTIGNPDWKLSYDTDKCVGCNHCIPVCPSRAITGLVPEPIL